MPCVGKKTKMLKSLDYSNCHEPLSQEWINEPSDNVLPKAKHASSSMLSYRVE